MAEQLKKIPITGYPYDETSKLVDYNMHTGVRTIKTEGYPAQQITSSQDRYNLKYAPSSLKEQSNQFINDQRSWDGIRKIKDAKSMSFDKWQSKWGGSENEWVSSKNQKLTAEDMDKISKEGGETYREKFVSPADRGDTTSSDAAQSKATSAAEGSQKRQQQATEDYKKSGYTGSFSEWDMAGSPDATQVAKDKAGADAYADAQKGTVTLNDKSTPAKQAGTTNEKSNNTNTMPKTLIDTLSSGARKLVDLALQTDNTTDLSSKSFWNTAPDADRKGAWAALQKITGSAKEMADYVKGTGLQNLQSLSWWSNSPHKQQAWSLVQQKQTAAPSTTTQAPTLTGTGTTDVSKGTGDWIVNPAKPDTTTGTDATKTDSTKVDDTTKADSTVFDSDKATSTALKALEANTFFQNLPEDQKAFLRMTVKSWNPTKEINMENVLAEFENIKSKTIDPQFKEQASVFINDVKDQMGNLEFSRNQELEAERTLGGENIRQAKAGLEKSGMTFTGKAIEDLGAQSAYAQEDQIPFGGRFYEGTVNQGNRLMSSGSLARYQQNIQSLGRQAENVLGQGASGLVPGASPAGVTTGTIEANRQKQLGTTLSQLAGQQSQLNSYKQPVDFTKFNQTFQ